MMGKDEDGDGIADQVDEDGDGILDDLYVPAAPGIDPFVARAAKTPKSTAMDCYRKVLEDEPTKDSRLHNKFMPGYGGYVPTEMDIKTSGGQWSPPRFLEVEAKAADVPFQNLGANQPPGPGAPPRSVVFLSRWCLRRGRPRHAQGRDEPHQMITWELAKLGMCDSYFVQRDLV